MESSPRVHDVDLQTGSDSEHTHHPRLTVMILAITLEFAPSFCSIYKFFTSIKQASFPCRASPTIHMQTRGQDQQLCRVVCSTATDRCLPVESSTPNPATETSTSGLVSAHLPCFHHFWCQCTVLRSPSSTRLHTDNSPFSFSENRFDEQQVSCPDGRFRSDRAHSGRLLTVTARHRVWCLPGLTTIATADTDRANFFFKPALAASPKQRGREIERQHRQQQKKSVSTDFAAFSPQSESSESHLRG